jgi:hypothetical protein
LVINIGENDESNSTASTANTGVGRTLTIPLTEMRYH